jgi:purine-cytosine permease-like protein
MWRAASFFIVLASAGGLCAVGIGVVDIDSSRATWMMMLASSVALIAGLAGIVATISRFIRCPNCGRVPTDEGAVDLFARKCPHCNTKLA